MIRLILKDWTEMRLKQLSTLVLLTSVLAAETAFACGFLFESVLARLKSEISDPFYDDGQATIKRQLELQEALAKKGVVLKRVSFGAETGRNINMEYNLDGKLVYGEYVEKSTMGQEVHPFVGRVVDTFPRGVGLYSIVVVEFLGGTHRTRSAEFYLGELENQGRVLKHFYRVRDGDEVPYIFRDGVLAGFMSGARRFVDSLEQDQMHRKWEGEIERFARAGDPAGHWERVDVRSVADFRRLTGSFVIGTGVRTSVSDGYDKLLMKFGGRVTGTEILPRIRELKLAEGSPNLPKDVDVYLGTVYKFVPSDLSAALRMHTHTDI